MHNNSQYRNQAQAQNQAVTSQFSSPLAQQDYLQYQPAEKVLGSSEMQLNQLRHPSHYEYPELRQFDTPQHQQDQFTQDHTPTMYSGESKLFSEPPALMTFSSFPVINTTTTNTNTTTNSTTTTRSSVYHPNRAPYIRSEDTYQPGDNISYPEERTELRTQHLAQAPPGVQQSHNTTRQDKLHHHPYLHANPRRHHVNQHLHPDHTSKSPSPYVQPTEMSVVPNPIVDGLTHSMTVTTVASNASLVSQTQTTIYAPAGATTGYSCRIPYEITNHNQNPYPQQQAHSHDSQKAAGLDNFPSFAPTDRPTFQDPSEMTRFTTSTLETKDNYIFNPNQPMGGRISRTEDVNTQRKTTVFPSRQDNTRTQVSPYAQQNRPPGVQAEGTFRQMERAGEEISGSAPYKIYPFPRQIKTEENNSGYHPASNNIPNFGFSLAGRADSNSTHIGIKPEPAEEMALMRLPVKSETKEPDEGETLVDITEYLNLPQSEAANRLGIPPSTLSKRWKEAAKHRKWPHRMVTKIDKEIATLLHNIPQGGVIPEEIEATLAALLAQRQQELKPIAIRL